MKEEERQERRKEKRRRWRRWRRKRILFLTSHLSTTCVEEQGLRDTLVAWIPKSNRTQPSWDHDWTLGLLLSHHPRGRHSPLLPQRNLRGSGWKDLSGTSLPLQSHWSIYLFDFGSFGFFVFISISPLEKKKRSRLCQVLPKRQRNWMGHMEQVGLRNGHSGKACQLLRKKCNSHANQQLWSSVYHKKYKHVLTQKSFSFWIPKTGTNPGVHSLQIKKLWDAHCHGTPAKGTTDKRNLMWTV